ncbi:DUF6259 domain-containing protein [Flavitalea antarctica]
MKLKIYLLLVFCHISFLQSGAQKTYELKNDQIEIIIDDKANLTALRNLQTGKNYASGKQLWRMYYDDSRQKDKEIQAGDSEPDIEQQNDTISITYQQLSYNGTAISFTLNLEITLEDHLVRFSSSIVNKQPHTIIRELQYPLIGNCQLSKDQQLLTTYWGGQIYQNPKKQIAAYNATYPPYYPPSQKFLQMDQRYPTGWAGGGLSANCFAFVGQNEGLYFGSHDTTFQDTGHGLRLYPGKGSVFDELEAGFYKYPGCLYGETWSCNANVISPYSGDWHRTSKIYREWSDTWWHHNDEPAWVKQMKGWQRIIMKHQYGEVLFPYSTLSKRVKSVGESVGLKTVLIHGWHLGGHDNDYPNYIPDSLQGGEKEFKKQIADFQKDGGAVLLYYSGRLMDKTSEYYKGEGKQICLRDNTGAEINDSYRFKGPGTFTGTYNSRTFAIADFREVTWLNRLKEMADQAIAYGAKSVFYDQMGWGEPADWDLSKEFPVPYLSTIKDKANALKQLHQYINERDKNIALGIELLTDVTAQNVDYIHARYGATEVLNPDWEQRGEQPRRTNFIDWFRFTFPEIILSDRDIRDDFDIERRVNHTVLKGLRNDVEIYRCRGLIDETPHYQQYLTKINKLKERFAELLLLGRYTDTEGLETDNKQIEARRFENKNKAAVVLTQSFLSSATTKLKIPAGYYYRESGFVGGVLVNPGKGFIEVSIKKNGLAVIVLEKL